MKRREAIYLVIIALLVAALVFSWRGCGRGLGDKSPTTTDTVVVRQTIRDTVLVARTRVVVRRDTVFVHVASDPNAAADTLVRAEIPIERATYETADYRAVVEGFRPTLVEMEIHRPTIHVTTTRTTTDRRRWGIGIQAGWGITTAGPKPYIGVGVQYSLVAW